METLFWLIMFVVLLVIEILTMGLTTVWFAGGALVAFVLAYVGFGLPVQIIVFLVVSIALLVLTRPIAMKFFNQERQKTNAESLIGQKAVVLEKMGIVNYKFFLLCIMNFQKRIFLQKHHPLFMKMSKHNLH